MEHVCDTCAKGAAFECDGCQRATYCDERCQTIDWAARHGAECMVGNPIGEKDFRVYFLQEDDGKFTNLGERLPYKLPLVPMMTRADIDSRGFKMTMVKFGEGDGGGAFHRTAYNYEGWLQRGESGKVRMLIVYSPKLPEEIPGFEDFDRKRYLASNAPPGYVLEHVYIDYPENLKRTADALKLVGAENTAADIEEILKVRRENEAKADLIKKQLKTKVVVLNARI